MIPVVRAAARRRTAESTVGPGDFPSGLTMWLKADAIMGKTDGQTITTWTDSSAAGNDATAGTAPTYKTNIAKGGTKPAVRFNGSSQYLVSSASASGAAQTIIAVFSIHTGGSAHTIRGASADGGLQFRVAAENALNLVNQSVVEILLDDASVSLNTFHVGAGTFNDSTNAATLRLDSNTTKSATLSTALTAGRTTYVGRHASNEFFDGDLCELATWSVVLAANDIASIVAGLTSKWV